MFDPAFHEVVEDIEAGLVALVAQFLERTGQSQVDATSVYLLLDAAFRFHLQRFLSGDRLAPGSFEERVTGLLATMTAATGSG